MDAQPFSLDSIRTIVGAEHFDNATPGMTLRPSVTAEMPPALAANASDITAPAAESPDSFARASEYTLLRFVAKGGMGEVHLAHQRGLRREVAVKKITPDHLARGETKRIEAAFVSEALITGYLDHPNIVPVHGLGRDDSGNWFFSMKMVRGIEWRKLLHPASAKDDETRAAALAHNLDVDDPARRAAHLGENLRVLAAVCNAVAFAHSRQIIHRDLKPENVMVGAFGEVLTMDWGLAVDVSENPQPDRRVPSRAESGFGGTPSYMAPEQVAFDSRGQPSSQQLGAWTDVFLLGRILYELLSGRAPYVAASLNGVLVKVAECAPPALPPETPAELAAICRKALAKNPRERFPDALSFQKALQEFLTHREASAIASKAEREAQTPEIPNLARAVVLYDQALELWPQNAAMAGAVKQARTALAAKEQRARWIRRSALGLAAAVFLSVTGGLLWVRHEKHLAETARLSAVAQQLAAQEAESRTTKQRDIALRSLDNLILGVQYKMEATPGLENLKLAMLREAHRGLKELAAVPGAGAAADHDRASSLVKVAELSSALRDTNGALEQYREALEIYERLAKEQPANAQYQRDLAATYGRLGETTLNRGDTAAAIEFHKKQVAASEQLAKDTASTPAQRDLSSAYAVLARLFHKQGDSTAALELYKKNVPVSERIAQLSPSVQSRRHVAYAYKSVGELSEAGESLEYYKKALEILDCFALYKPGDTSWQREVAPIYSTVVSICIMLKKDEDTIAYGRKWYAVVEEQLTAAPADAKLRAQVSRVANIVAWTLLSTEQAGLRNPKEAQQLALRAVELSYGQEAAYLDTLAMAQFRAGDKTAAIETQKKAIAMLRPDAKPHLKKDLLDHLKEFESAPAP